MLETNKTGMLLRNHKNDFFVIFYSFELTFKRHFVSPEIPNSGGSRLDTCLLELLGTIFMFQNYSFDLFDKFACQKGVISK